MANIYVVRHGKTKMNKNNIILGTIDSPLLKSSIKEIKKLASKLDKLKINEVYSSDLKRAKNTAKIIQNELTNKLKIKTKKELGEVRYGTLSGKTKKNMKKKYPQYHNNIYFKHPKGESFDDMYKRVIRFIKKIENKNKNILIVTHSGCLRAIYSYFKNENFQKHINMKTTHHMILKCRKNKLEKRVKIMKD